MDAAEAEKRVTMDSFPQLVRCFAHQWAGLTETERRVIVLKRNESVYFRGDENMIGRGVSVWIIEHGDGSSLSLISLKYG